MVSTFQLREGESSLSVNWLEFLDPANRLNAIQLVRDAFAKKRFAIRPTGRFAAINVGDAKEAAKAIELGPLKMEHAPSQRDQSHALISGYDESNDLEVATELWALVQSSDIYPAVVS